MTLLQICNTIKNIDGRTTHAPLQIGHIIGRKKRATDTCFHCCTAESTSSVPCNDHPCAATDKEIKELQSIKNTENEIEELADLAAESGSPNLGLEKQQSFSYHNSIVKQLLFACEKFSEVRESVIIANISRCGSVFAVQL
uniref:Uncharacterized protein n=1 Tax=Magallana gigas TaxID=29159 RepID=K1Q5I6_MAGGI